MSPMPIDAVIVKATEGLSYVDPTCDPNVLKAKAKGIPFGFYHFAGTHGAIEEADFFIRNCEGYFHDGIPVLDWEGEQGVGWVNQFVRYVHDVTGVWCWIYANPWRFNQGGVEENCMRWVASYPYLSHPTFDEMEQWDCPSAEGFVGAWQFCSDGRVEGYDGDLDCDLFYGDLDAWNLYSGKASHSEHPSHEPQVFECEHFRIEVR